MGVGEPGLQEGAASFQAPKAETNTPVFQTERNDMAIPTQATTEVITPRQSVPSEPSEETKALFQNAIFTETKLSPTDAAKAILDGTAIVNDESRASDVNTRYRMTQSGSEAIGNLDATAARVKAEEQIRIDTELKSKYGLSLTEARSFMTELHDKGKVSDTLFQHSMNLNDEDLVTRVAKFYPKDRNLAESLDRLDTIAKDVKQKADEEKTAQKVQDDAKVKEMEKKQKLDMLQNMYAKRLGIPPEYLDMDVLNKVIGKLYETVDLGNETPDKIQKQVEIQLEKDKDLKEYVLELYKAKVYEKAYNQRKSQLVNNGTYPTEYIEEQSKQFAIQAVKSVNQLLEKDERDDNINDGIGEIIVFLADTLIEQSIMAMAQVGGGR